MLGSKAQGNRTKINVLIIVEPQDILFCFILPLEARHEF